MKYTYLQQNPRLTNKRVCMKLRFPPLFVLTERFPAVHNLTGSVMLKFTRTLKDDKLKVRLKIKGAKIFTRLLRR
jgi:hypothetical protein